MCVCCGLTEFIKVRLDTIGCGHRTDEPGLQKGAPLVHQTTVAAVVILQGRKGRMGVIHHYVSFMFPRLTRSCVRQKPFKLTPLAALLLLEQKQLRVSTGFVCASEGGQLSLLKKGIKMIHGLEIMNFCSRLFALSE